jgi:hypothetical protein
MTVVVMTVVVMTVVVRPYNGLSIWVLYLLMFCVLSF